MGVASDGQIARRCGFFRSRLCGRCQHCRKETNRFLNRDRYENAMGIAATRSARLVAAQPMAARRRRKRTASAGNGLR